MTELEFLANDANEDEGLGDAGISTFQDRPYASAAKEAGQNSRDAMLKKPVKMTFILHKIPRSEIPFIDKLTDTISCCIDRVEKRYNEKDADFFLKAQEVLERDEINVLEIADFNTKGLEGPAEEGSPFYALLKGSGVSSKGDESTDASSGSFGIGKNASFAISELRTVLYSTVYADEKHSQHFLAQGKVKLVSHTDKQGEKKKATGWWGGSRFSAIHDQNLVPAWMRRKEMGTSVYSVGFRVESDWEYRVVAALLRTFFISIHKGEMEFDVASSIRINKDTLAEWFDNDRVKQAVAEMHLEEDFDFAKSLYICERSPNADIRNIKLKTRSGLEHGYFDVKIFKANGMPKRVGFVRNGMLITDNLKTFGHPFMRFPMCADFVALVTPSNKETGALLKKLENPAHDQFSAERISDDVKRDSARKLLEAAGKAIRDIINEVTKATPKEVEVIEELAEYFADPRDMQDSTDGEDSLDRYKYRSVAVRARRPKVRGGDDGSSGGGGKTRTRTDGGASGTEAGPGNGKKGPKNFITLSGCRNLIENKRRKLWFTPIESAKGCLQILATGVNDETPLRIKSSSQGTVRDGQLELELKEQERVILFVELEEEYAGPIQLSAYMRDEHEAG